MQAAAIPHAETSLHFGNGIITPDNVNFAQDNGLNAEQNERARDAVRRHLEDPMFQAHLAHLAEVDATGPMALEVYTAADGVHRVHNANLSFRDMSQTIEAWTSANWADCYWIDLDDAETVQ